MSLSTTIPRLETDAGPAAAHAATAAVPRPRRWVRKLHLVVGLVCTVNFLVLLGTGFLVQHRQFFALEQKTISRGWLPSGYRPLDPDRTVRADIVVTDLHSGRLYGRYGMLVVDAMTVGWFLMIATGIGIVLVRRLRPDNGKGKLIADD